MKTRSLSLSFLTKNGWINNEYFHARSYSNQKCNQWWIEQPVPLLSRVCIHDFPIRWFIQTYLFVKNARVSLFDERKKKKITTNNHVYRRNTNICVDFILSFVLIWNEYYSYYFINKKVIKLIFLLFKIPKDMQFSYEIHYNNVVYKYSNVLNVRLYKHFLSQ